MIIKNRDLTQYGITDSTELPVYLISQDLLMRKFWRTLSHIGFDNTFCRPELTEVILFLCGFQERSDELFDLYYELLDIHCKKISSKYTEPFQEALAIYRTLLSRHPLTFKPVIKYSFEGTH